ncbi:UrcA family protein [Novosphingobium mathurense]|uniref:UrcA family protein n=1 Tax=Novosphingobium mathurense TaxID=428990 RepID=A0A1U6HUU1_9SPHN|nr:UrcA family protein [Novosphingobium mathurense]SLJ99509.1 UrcA family protein [Novosphingobium mathurense]
MDYWTRIIGTAALGSMCLALWAAVAGAQEQGPVDGQEPTAPEEIVVEAPRSVPARIERSSTTGAPIVTTTVRIPVLYNDLDLSQPHDQDRLMTRVRSVARAVCDELDRIYPFNPDQDCVTRALANGTKAAQQAIAEAQTVP